MVFRRRESHQAYDHGLDGEYGEYPDAAYDDDNTGGVVEHYGSTYEYGSQGYVPSYQQGEVGSDGYGGIEHDGQIENYGYDDAAVLPARESITQRLTHPRLNGQSYEDDPMAPYQDNEAAEARSARRKRVAGIPAGG